MKKAIVLLNLFLLLGGYKVFASHLAGGEISWTCNPEDGTFRFLLTVFVDCTSDVPFVYVNDTLEITGSPLPRDENGAEIRHIIIKPDSNRWMNSNNGDTSPQCNGRMLDCDAGNEGTIRAYWHISDPITLNGTPPPNGWTFTYEAPCCRSATIRNINSSGDETQGLRAIMFPLPEDPKTCVPQQQCDNSPVFQGLPVSAICRGYTFTYNHTAIDAELDSLVYSPSTPFNINGALRFPVAFNSDFTAASPTPSAIFDARNISYTLDPLTGITRFGVFSSTIGGSDAAEVFTTTVRVDAFRAGQRIASIFRELNVTVNDCPSFPANGRINNPPEVFINGRPAESEVFDVIAGQDISIPIQVVDNDFTGSGLGLQRITLVPDGVLFTRTSAPSTDPALVTVAERGEECISPSLAPCAFLQNQTPVEDVSLEPADHTITGLGTIQTEFVWQTDCKHVTTCTGQPGTNVGIYNFVMRVLDDHCPVPAINYPTITVAVKDPIPLTEPVMKGISVNLDGTVEYNWVPPIDSANQFDSRLNPSSYEIEGTRVRPNRPLTGWAPVDNGVVTNYLQSRRTNGFPVYDLINIFEPDGPVNVFSHFQTVLGIDNDFYMRMRTLSGCQGTVESIYSEPARVMELEAEPSGVAPDLLRSRARLSWNRAKRLDARTYSYFDYESPTHYRIWVNDSISPIAPDGSSEGILNPNNWYVAGMTTDTTFELPSSVCADFVAFRIEGLDTVRTFRQGANFNQLDSIQELTYSTFSTVDTLFMIANNSIRVPNFDTVAVQADGSILLRIDLSNRGAVAMFNVYQVEGLDTTLVGSVLGNEDSLVVTPSGDALNEEINLLLEAIGQCDPLQRTRSAVYNTFIPTSEDGAFCSGTFVARWDEPAGFPIQPNGEDVVGYRVYVDFGSGLQLVSTLNGARSTTAIIPGIIAGMSYDYQIVAFDINNDVIISPIKTYVAPEGTRNNDIVPPPDSRCTFVNDDGSVTLSWVPPLDTSNNFGRYSIRWRDAGTLVWNSIADRSDTLLTYNDSVYTVEVPVGEGGFAQERQIEFELNTLSGCNGTIPNPNPSIISTVFLTVVPQNDRFNSGNASWNSTGIDYTPRQRYDLHKEDISAGINGYQSPFFERAIYNGIDTHMAVDEDNLEVCGDTIDYYVRLEDNLFEPNYTCEVRSNLVSELFTGGVVPPAHNLRFISFNLATRGFDAFYQDTNRPDRITLISPAGFNSGLPQFNSIAGLQTIDSLGGGLANFFVPNTVLDGRDSPIEISSVAISDCGTPSPEEDYLFHRSMAVDVEFVMCDSINVITWTPYIGFPTSFAVEYVVYVSTNGGVIWTPLNANNPTIDTTFSDIVEIGGLNYLYHVRAMTRANPAYVSNSNIDSIVPIYLSEPRFGYLSFATVAGDGSVDLEYYRDTATLVNGYTLLRGETPNNLNSLDFANYNNLNADESRVRFNDATAETNEQSYYYAVSPENQCGVGLDSSNFGKTILLQVSANNDAFTNILRWNSYEEWDSTVAFYNLYRGVDGRPSNDVFRVLAPGDSINTYVDDVFDELNAIGEFCYRIEAVQGPIDDIVVNGFPHDLESATSSSNVVCVTQESRLFIPNAFAPNGVNRIFAPKGQFFDNGQFEMRIYNRWGELIYETQSINQGWNGEVNGQEAALGSYVYEIKIVDATGRERERRGTFTLIR